MTSFRKTFFLPLIALTLLASCNNPFDKTVHNNGSADNQNIASVVAPEFHSRYGSDLSCALLRDEQSRQVCQLRMNDMIGGLLESEIISSFDVRRCNELTPEIADICQKRLNEAGVKGPVSTQEQDLFADIVRGRFPELSSPSDSQKTLYPVYDPSRCAELKTPGYPAYCEKTINDYMDRNKFDQIIQSDNAGQCDELNNDLYISRCKQFFETSN